MIDQQVHDALEAQVVARDPAEPWRRVERAGTAARRRRGRRRWAGVAIVALLVLAGSASLVATRSSAARRVTTDVPPTSAAPATGPAPARNVAALDPAITFSDRNRVDWFTARTGSTDRDLVIWAPGCHDRYAARVLDGPTVTVELSDGDGAHLACLMTEAVLVPLPTPLDGRPVSDGVGGVKPVLDGSALLVPHWLPNGLRAQTEDAIQPSPQGTTSSVAPGTTAPSRSGLPGQSGWTVCYEADAPEAATAGTCSPTRAIPGVVAVQGAEQWVLDAATAPAVELVTPTPGRPPLATVFTNPQIQGQPVGHDDLVPAHPVGTIDGQPAVLVSTGIHEVVLWDVGATWYAVATLDGAGGVSQADLLRIARSMAPVG